MIETEKSLDGLQTFGLQAKARQFATVGNVADLQKLIKSHHHQNPLMILGGGSNVLFVQDYAGLLIANRMMGREVVRTTAKRVHVRIGAGENWDPFVAWAVENNYGGAENLSLIPGTVGASPIQNIGAYGVEIKDIFISCTAIDLKTGKKRSFNKAQCQFGYRDSIFKREAKGRYCITSVTFSLSTTTHQIRTSYGDIIKQLEVQNAPTKPSIADIRQAVIAIRSSKLPDPAKIGNCGSFFKNPEVPTSKYEALKAAHQTIPGYPTLPGQTKVPAGWLIEQCGWKGKRVGNTGCYEKQALVIVNHGGATGAEVQQLVNDIIASVAARFGIALEPEVQMVGGKNH
jgi:UDP-N-acetylmuramate dehydrogenase